MGVPFPKTEYLKRDKSISGVATAEDEKIADRIIRNTYKTLLSRGQKGCYIFCEDPELRTYIKQRLEMVRINKAQSQSN